MSRTSKRERNKIENEIENANKIRKIGIYPGACRKRYLHVSCVVLLSALFYINVLSLL